MTDVSKQIGVGRVSFLTGEQKQRIYDTALGILSECFPGRSVIGIHAVDLVWGLGTLHCLTQQEPREEAPGRHS